MAIRCKYNSPHSINKFIIDGSNNYLSLKSIQVREERVKWTRLFDSLGRGVKAQHWEVLWIRPQRLQRIMTPKEDIIQELYQRRYPEDWKHRLQRSKQINRLPAEIHQDFKRTKKEMNRWFWEEKVKFQQSEAYYDALQRACSNIHIHKVGKLQLDPFNIPHIREKGIDPEIAIKITEAAADMHVGCITLISGDGDFVEAVKKAKKKKPVYLVEYLGNGNKGDSTSWDLREAASEVISIHRDQLLGKFSVHAHRNMPSKSNYPVKEERKLELSGNSFKRMPPRKSAADVDIALAS